MSPLNTNLGGGGKMADAMKPGADWKQLTKAGHIYEAGNAVEYDTGDWRTIRPIFIEDKCIHCLFCWRFCPDSAVFTEDGKFESFDYMHCKGCGICADVCPTDAIDMVPEDEADKQKEASEDDK